MAFNVTRLKIKGMSLIEFLTVISIVIVLTTVATPFLGSLISRYQAESAGYHILATLKFCRAEALKRENDVSCTIHASDTNKNVLTKIFLDDDTSGAYEEGKDTLLSSSTISNTSFLQITPADSQWIYNRQGVSDNVTVGQLQLCSLMPDKKVLLNTIYIDPLGVTYIKEAEADATCA